MQQNTANINWAKQALTFIARLGVVENYQEWFGIVQQCMGYLQELSGADHIILLKNEDAVTTRAIGINSEKEDVVYIDPELLSKFTQGLEPLCFEDILDLPAKLLDLVGSPLCLMALPIKQLDINGYIVLAWENKFDFSDDFKEFANACLNKINETIRLTRTYYSLEELKVRFNAILQTVPQSIVFIDDYRWR